MTFSKNSAFKKYFQAKGYYFSFSMTYLMLEKVLFKKILFG